VNEVPKELQQLIAEAQCWANEAWVLVSEDCYGIKVKSMTLRHLMMLDGIETPFLKGGDIKDEDIALFLWIVSEDYSTEAKAKKEFFKKAVKLRLIPTINWIKEYIKKSFSDSDTMSIGEKGQAYFISYFVDLFAREYGWSFEQIMEMPLRVGFQLLTAINERNAKKVGEKYQRITEVDNQINRWILKGNSNNGI